MDFSAVGTITNRAPCLDPKGERLSRLEIRFRYRVLEHVAERKCYDFEETEQTPRAETDWLVQSALSEKWVHLLVELPESAKAMDYVDDNLHRWAQALEKKYFCGLTCLGEWQPNQRLRPGS